MRQRTALGLAAVLVAGLGLTACNETGSPRCDTVLLEQNIRLGDMGWTLRCDPDRLGYQPPSWVTGWANTTDRIVAVWPNRLPDDRTLGMIAFHEYGHAWLDVHGQPQDETRASQIGWCTGGWKIDGVSAPGWGPPPGGC